MFIGKDGQDYPTMADVMVANGIWLDQHFPKYENIKKIYNVNNFEKPTEVSSYDGLPCTSEGELMTVNDILLELSRKLISKIYMGLDGVPYDSEEKRVAADITFINKLGLESISYSDSEAHHR